MNPTALLVRATVKLTRLRVRLWWNSIKHSDWKRRFGYAAAGLGLLAFAGFLVFASWGLLTLLSSPRLAQAMQQAGADMILGELLNQLPVYFGVGAFLAGVFTSFGVLLQSLYLSGDMEFLLVAPLPPRAVFASKLIQAIVPSLLVLGLFSGPALVGLGLSQGYPLAYYLLLPITLTLLIVSGAGLSAVLVMLVVRLVPPRRAAEVLGLLGGLIGVVCSQTGQLTNRFDVSPDQMAGAFGTLESLTSSWNPLSWPGLGLSEIGQRHWLDGTIYMGLTVVGGLGLLAITLSAAERLYFSGWARVQVGETGRRSRARSGKREAVPSIGLAMRVLPPPVQALVVKDVRMYQRDLRNLSQLVTPILFAVIWTLTLSRTAQEPELTAGPQALIRLGTMGIALFVGWMFALRFAMGGLSMEGRRWWILKTAPLRSGHLLLAKFLIALIPSAGLSLAYLAVTAIIRNVEAALFAYQALAVLLITSAECSLLLAVGVWTARFDWDNPREISSGLSGCLGWAGATAFLALATGLFIGLPILGEALDFPPALGWAVGFTGGLLVCGLAGILPLALASRKLPTLGEA